MAYNWIYTTSNENAYILILIIIMLFLIIINFNLWKRKDKFYDITTTTLGNPTTTAPLNTYGYNWVKLDNDEETLSNDNYINNYENNNMQINSTLYDSSLYSNSKNTTTSTIPTTSTSYNNIPTTSTTSTTSTIPTTTTTSTTSTTSTKSNNVKSSSTIGDYATLDSIGSTLTDSLGGINSSLGYAILDDQLGTFTPTTINNPHTYDNTQNYKSGMNPNTINGIYSNMTGTDLNSMDLNSMDLNSKTLNGSCLNGNKPISLKDFDGVANIFAPNIIIQNAPLTSDGLPDISFSM